VERRRRCQWLRRTSGIPTPIGKRIQSLAGSVG
jgi:hypothetical protein